MLACVYNDIDVIKTSYSSSFYGILILVLSESAEYGSKTGAGLTWFAHIGEFFAGRDRCDEETCRK